MCWCVLLANFSLCGPPLFHLGDGKQDREEHLDITKREGEGGLRTHSAINQPRAKKGNKWPFLCLILFPPESLIRFPAQKMQGTRGKTFINFLGRSSPVVVVRTSTTPRGGKSPSIFSQGWEKKKSWETKVGLVVGASARNLVRPPPPPFRSSP